MCSDQISDFEAAILKWGGGGGGGGGGARGAQLPHGLQALLATSYYTL